MSTKENNLKEKFKIALTSTAKVIADDFDVKKTNSEEKKIKEFNFLEIDNLTSPADFIRLRAETDSSALKKKFCNETIYKKNLPSNTSSRSLQTIAEKIRYETLGGKMLKGIEKNFQENYNQIINKIQKIRAKNNVNWMNILKLAFKLDPKNSAKIMKKINYDDKKISELLKKLG